MKSKTENILSALRVLAWIGIIGYAVNLGSQLISFGVSFVNPAASQQIPGVSQNLFDLLRYNFRYYVYAMSIVIALSAMFVSLWYQVVQLLSKINIKSPFTFDVSRKLEKIACWLFSIWIVGFVGEKYIDWLSKSIGQRLDIVSIGSEFLFIAGIVYIISQIFKHGVEIQEENQQTV